MERRQSHPAVGVSWSDHERWTLFESMDQEAACGVLVHELHEQSKPRQRRGVGLGHCMWVEPTSGFHRDDVPRQPQKVGKSKTSRHAEPVDTRGLQVKMVRHEESGSESGPLRLDHETTTRTENRAVNENHGL